MTYTDQYYVTYRARGIFYALNGFDLNTNLTINYLGDQGFGLAPLHRITTRGPLQDGDTDIDFRLDPRVLQLPLMVQNTNTTQPRWQSYIIRRQLLSIFRPSDSAILSVEAIGIGAALLSRSINVRVLGGLSFDVDPQDFHVRTVVQLRADDPTWYDEVSITNLTIPRTQFGIAQTLTYAGQWKDFPIIQATGPITNFTITNLGKTLNVPGTIAAGVTYYFDLRYGYNTVYTGPNQTGTNVIANLNPTSDLATWAFIPGVNSITATGTGLTAASSVFITYYNRYAGI